MQGHYSSLKNKQTKNKPKYAATKIIEKKGRWMNADWMRFINNQEHMLRVSDILVSPTPAGLSQGASWDAVNASAKMVGLVHALVPLCIFV